MRWYDRDGNPTTRETVITVNAEEGKVALTQVGESTVSTVWLGFDAIDTRQPPLIYETLVFDGPLDLVAERYATEEEARAGHERMVERVRATVEGIPG